MKKITFLIISLFLLIYINACAGYKPIFASSDFQFKIADYSINGNKKLGNKIYSNGGRVLNFVVLSDSFKLSRIKAIQLIKKLNWTNGFYRKDIGFKVIK